MNRLLVIFGALALLGSAASAAFYVRAEESRKTFELRLAGANERAVKFEAELTAAQGESDTLKSRIAAIDAELAATKANLTAAHARVAELEADYVRAKTVLSLYEATARGLADEVGALRQDLFEARASNASPEAVEGYRSTIAELERQLANARDGAALPTAAGAATAVFASRPGRATVLTVGPESAFVVLNFGAVRGAQIGQKLSVSQGTDVVATVLISDVRSNFSIAHVLPDTLRGVLHKGDSAVLLR